LWDLLGILGGGADFVIGDHLSPWRVLPDAVEIVTGRLAVEDAATAWRWLSNPLPPASEDTLFAQIRDNLTIRPDQHTCSHGFEDLDYLVKEVWLPTATDPSFFTRNNPLLRHVVLRKRAELENAGLLEKVGVNTHPMLSKSHLYQARFTDLGIPTNRPFEVAYEKAEEFCRLLQQRTKIGGFMKTLLLQRICSSFAASLATARTMLGRVLPDDVEEEQHD
jgi:hypothetical protein